MTSPKTQGRFLVPGSPEPRGTQLRKGEKMQAMLILLQIH